MTHSYPRHFFLLAAAAVVVAVIVAIGRTSRSRGVTDTLPSGASPPSSAATNTVRAGASASGAAMASSGSWVRYGAVPGKGTRVSIEGTSSLHDWLVAGLMIGGSLEVGPAFPLEPTQAAPGRLEARAEVYIPARSLKSMKDGKAYSNAMDDIMYGKLLESQYKRVVYRLTELHLKEIPREAGAPAALEARGDLVVAGVTNTITMPVHLVWPRPNQLRFSGSINVKMTDFRIDPPSPKVVDFIKTGDEVTLRFDWLVQRK